MHVNYDKTLQKNMRLDIRKTPIDETETPQDNPHMLGMIQGRQSKHSKDHTKKDPYHWLDENDTRRHMTDKEIIESTISYLVPFFQQICLEYIIIYSFI